MPIAWNGTCASAGAEIALRSGTSRVLNRADYDSGVYQIGAV